jgi:hypothetical protein
MKVVARMVPCSWDFLKLAAVASAEKPMPSRLRLLGYYAAFLDDRFSHTAT